MKVSLNEIAATAKRATRGARYPWGLAEEAGHATRWLCARDLPGADALAGQLHQTEHASGPPTAPDTPTHAQWSAANGPLCPLLTGCTLSDFAPDIWARPLTLTNLSYPLLLLPFAAHLARNRERALTLSWGTNGATVDLTTDGQTVSFQNRPLAAALCSTKTHLACLTPANSTTNPTAPLRTRAILTSENWGILNRLAWQTYAPATDASRRLGAGSDLSDND